MQFYIKTIDKLTLKIHYFKIADDLSIFKGLRLLIVITFTFI
ncbi:hypothetical protein LCDVSa126L [Lymphocystis disease virus 3]|uniref:Uncharacterized protein n=1 Tax=Lymphocystis disease virus 3 TaxID=2560566 RepID=A0A1B2RW23_9VIRU|nr:hypothetical protein BZK12_gp126 [Lymphocystis disease virus Sa]AOC55210.1 hypothetical protein LCDVSa126L [Lymphocystis disease virus 3]